MENNTFSECGNFFRNELKLTEWLLSTTLNLVNTISSGCFHSLVVQKYSKYVKTSQFWCQSFATLFVAAFFKAVFYCNYYNIFNVNVFISLFHWQNDFVVIRIDFYFALVDIFFSRFNRSKGVSKFRKVALYFGTFVKCINLDILNHVLTMTNIYTQSYCN